MTAPVEIQQNCPPRRILKVIDTQQQQQPQVLYNGYVVSIGIAYYALPDAAASALSQQQQKHVHLLPGTAWWQTFS
jgi:hypothetical protein